MPVNAVRNQGTVYKNRSAVFLGRVENAAGALVLPDDIASAAYTVYLLSPYDQDYRTPVAGHANVALTPSAILYATLQTGGSWKKDSAGYNFRHQLDVSQSQAFGTAGRTYLVEYVLTPTSGQPISLQFLCQAI